MVFKSFQKELTVEHAAKMDLVSAKKFSVCPGGKKFHFQPKYQERRYV